MFVSLLIAAALAVAPASAVPAQEPAVHHARGTFEVSITPVPPAPDAVPGAPGRMVLAKTFHGGIEGTGGGEMLGVLEGQSGAYVALERVEASVDGRRGSFALVHRGVMTDGAQDLSITVVPGSGTGGLVGIAGTFHLTIEGRQHRYDLEYTLPKP